MARIRISPRHVCALCKESVEDEELFSVVVMRRDDLRAVDLDLADDTSFPPLSFEVRTSFDSADNPVFSFVAHDDCYDNHLTRQKELQISVIQEVKGGDGYSEDDERVMTKENAYMRNLSALAYPFAREIAAVPSGQWVDITPMEYDGFQLHKYINPGEHDNPKHAAAFYMRLAPTPLREDLVTKRTLAEIPVYPYIDIGTFFDHFFVFDVKPPVGHGDQLTPDHLEKVLHFAQEAVEALSDFRLDYWVCARERKDTSLSKSANRDELELVVVTRLTLRSERAKVDVVEKALAGLTYADLVGNWKSEVRQALKIDEMHEIITAAATKCMTVNCTTIEVLEQPQCNVLQTNDGGLEVYFNCVPPTALEAIVIVRGHEDTVHCFQVDGKVLPVVIVPAADARAALLETLQQLQIQPFSTLQTLTSPQRDVV